MRAAAGPLMTIPVGVVIERRKAKECVGGFLCVAAGSRIARHSGRFARGLPSAALPNA